MQEVLITMLILIILVALVTVKNLAFIKLNQENMSAKKLDTASGKASARDTLRAYAIQF